MTDVDGNPLESLCKILSSSTSSSDLKGNVAQLCFALFNIPKIRALPMASECIKPLILLMQSENSTAVESGVYASERLLDEATASEDTAADDLIQKTIRGQTSKCTIHSHLCILNASTPYSDWITEQEAKRNTNNAGLPKACPCICSKR